VKRLEPFVGTWHMESSLGDARAVTTFEWTLERDDEDFAQCYVGEFSGGRIDGRWEMKRPDESAYRLDFELSYVRT
jgi:hypothetical protein